MVWVEIAGPTQPHTVMLVPDQIRGMAGWVVEQCVAMTALGGKNGGFTTWGLTALVNFVLEPTTRYSSPFYRKASNLL